MLSIQILMHLYCQKTCLLVYRADTQTSERPPTLIRVMYQLGVDKKT